MYHIICGTRFDICIVEIVCNAKCGNGLVYLVYFSIQKNEVRKIEEFRGQLSQK
jgi:hypothetical protein